MRNVAAFGGSLFDGEAGSIPSEADVIHPRSIFSTRGKSRWFAGRFVITVPLARMRLPSK